MPAGSWHSTREILIIIWASALDTLRAYWDVAQQVPATIWAVLGITTIMVLFASHR